MLRPRSSWHHQLERQHVVGAEAGEERGNAATGLLGRRALVTGGSRGIGRAIGSALARAGATVILSARPSAELDLAAQNMGGVAIPGDLRVPQDVEALARRAGDVDILVNNAAAKASYTAVLDSSDHQWEEHLSVSLLGPLRLIRALAPGMVARRRGVIITMTSSASVVPVPLIGPYSVSKRAAEWLTKLVAMELGPSGIRAVCVAPGLTGTDVAEHLANSGQLGNWTDSTPLGRIGSTDEMAELIAWLASDASAYITGTTIVADGGNTAGQFHLMHAMKGTAFG